MRNKYLRFADVLFLLSFVAGTTMTACSEQPYQPTLKATSRQTNIPCGREAPVKIRLTMEDI